MIFAVGCKSSFADYMKKVKKEDTDEARNIVFTKKLHNENKSVALC